MDTTFNIKVKQLTSFNEIVEPIYQNFDKKYQDILFYLINNWLKINNINDENINLLKDYIEELVNEYSEYQSGSKKWSMIKKINVNDFDNC